MPIDTANTFKQGEEIIPYKSMPRELFKHKDISLEAKGLMGYLYSVKPTWELRIEIARKELGIGQNKMYRIINELIEHGYISRVPYVNEKGQKRFRPYTWYRDPMQNPHFNQLTENQLVEIQQVEIGEVKYRDKRVKEISALAEPLQSAQRSSEISETDLSASADIHEESEITDLNAITSLNDLSIAEQISLRTIHKMTVLSADGIAHGENIEMINRLAGYGLINDFVNGDLHSYSLTELEQSLFEDESDSEIDLCMDKLMLHVKRFLANTKNVEWKTSSEWTQDINKVDFEILDDCGAFASEYHRPNRMVYRLNAEWLAAFKLEYAKEQTQVEDIAPQEIKTLDDLDVRLRVVLVKMNRRWIAWGKLILEGDIDKQYIAQLTNFGLIESKRKKGKLQGGVFTDFNYLYRISLAGKALLAPAKKASVKPRNDKLVEILELAYGVKAASSDYGLWVKRAQEMYADLIGDLNDCELDNCDWDSVESEFKLFIEWVRKGAKEIGWTVTIHNLTGSGRLSEYLNRGNTPGQREIRIYED